MSTPYGGGPAPEQVPVCPRHPDRVSYVRCQRCGRPTCTECQRPAAVGIHCVDCVREANRTAPVARTAFGAPLRAGRPLVTLTLIGVTVVSYLLQLAVGDAWTNSLLFAPGIGDAEPWRFLTGAFVHYPSGTFGITHILFNMYALWILGHELEPALGRARFLALYLVSALGGHVMILLLASPFSPAWVTGTVGASGAVFGLFGAIAVVLRRMGRSARPILGVVAINAVIGFLVPGISWQGHLGGLLTGALIGVGFAYAPKARRRVVGIGVTVGVALVLVVMAAIKYASW
ncbi:rhomboid family intramembrane serine protease [Actinotalea subterranea]|uniref:rhomboid family intramembrane serine protease n=1 Tax=Actinotalea subterranea TaxID=2607497 RepID=UPI0011EFDD6E|nr:rhomboid family intramembrane serine protease [Actinotalea subterranea]